MRSFRLSPLATHDIEAIWNYSASKWNIDRAESYIRQIQKTCELLVRDAHLGHACDEVRPGYRKIRSGSHIVFYREANGDIEIVRILHQSMDFNQHM